MYWLHECKNVMMLDTKTHLDDKTGAAVYLHSQQTHLHSFEIVFVFDWGCLWFGVQKFVHKLVTYFNLSASQCWTSEIQKVYQEFSCSWKQVAAAGTVKKVRLNEVMCCETKSTTSKRWWSVGSSWHHMTRFCLINEGYNAQFHFIPCDWPGNSFDHWCVQNKQFLLQQPSVSGNTGADTHKLCVIVALYTRDKWEQRAAFQFQGQ